jgi:N-acetylornithine carbamoyltransferase
MREFARWADIPVINMECDKYHPCQGLADVLTVKEKLGRFRGVKYVMSWAYSPSIEKPRAVPQSAILYPTLLGMDVTLAHPKGMELDEEVLAACRTNAEKNGGSFKIEHDFEKALKGAHVVYPKSWTAVPTFAPPIGTRDEKKSQSIFDANKDWICDAEHMALADKNAIYMHCLPCDRGFEVTNEVVDGPQSVVFDEAENRLHVQKAVMSLIMR